MALYQSIYDTQLKQYQADPETAHQVLDVGVAPVDAGANVAKLAALTTVATVIMNAPDSYFIQ